MTEKFRALDRNANAWEVLTIDELTNGETTSWSDVDIETVTRFTGTKDKLGIEIFNGDICKCHDDTTTPIVEIKWDDEWGCIVLTGKRKQMRFEDDTEYSKDTLNHAYAKDLEVIGNIYQNPDLLK